MAAIELVLFALAMLLFRVRQTGWGALLLCGVVLAEGVRAHPEGVIPVAGALLTWCHVMPALLWAGMLVYALRTAVAWRGDPAAARGAIRLYSSAAAWLFAIVVATGVISALVLVPIGSLLTTTYGLFLIAKAVVVGLAAGLALAGRIMLRRRPASADGPALATKVELAALALVLAVTGILTVITPPAKATSVVSPGLRRPAISSRMMSAVPLCPSRVEAAVIGRGIAQSRGAHPTALSYPTSRPGRCSLSGPGQ